MDISQHDKAILRELGAQIAEIAALPVRPNPPGEPQQHQQLQRAKPTIHIYQEPWNELDVDGELQLRTQHPFCRSIEGGLRRTLYSWKHMPGDMVVEALIVQPLCIRDTGFGIEEDVDIVRTDDTSDVVSRHFHIQISEEADVAKIKTPVVCCDWARTAEEFAARQEIFAGILPVEQHGCGGFWFAPWDELVRWTGVQEILLDMAERPEYVNLLMDHFVTAWLARLDQYEAQGLLARPASELWGHGAAQIFSEVSPAMHEEFALQHEARFYKRWGKSYYGCCEPLHHKVDICRKHIPNLRKISMSPWVDFDRAVRNVGDTLVFAWKPNPAVLASDNWDPDYVRRDMEEKLEKAKDCHVEIHMKDISTVRYQPQRLWEWAQIAREVAEKYA